MYDAVYLFAKALHDLDTSQQIDINPINCDSIMETFSHGFSLINYMKVVRETVLLKLFSHAFVNQKCDPSKAYT
jgi:ionotropic kainate glutamate receptor 2